MYKIIRENDAKGGIKRIHTHKSVSGTIALMCPKCYNITYINGSYNTDFKYNDINLCCNISMSYFCKYDNQIVFGIELDPNIAEAIAMLNKKGYITKFCCEGHTKNGKPTCTPYILFESGNLLDKIKLPETWELEYQFSPRETNTIIRSNLEKYSKKKILIDLVDWVYGLKPLH